MGDLFATFGINWTLLVIQGVNFGVLLLVLWYVLYRPLARMLDERAEKIKAGVAAAAAAHETLEQSVVERDGMLASAAQESERMIAEAKGRAHEKADELLRGAADRADSIIADAAARAEEAHREALKGTEREIARAAILAAEKILKERTH